MPGNVNRSAVIVVVDQRALAEHVVQHTENGFFVPGNDSRRENHGVPFVEREQPVRIHGEARKRRHRLSLAAAHQDHQFFRRIRRDILRPHHQSVRNAQAVHAMRDLDVVHHAAPDESHLASRGCGNVHDLLDARDRGRKARHDHLARRRSRQFFDAGPHHPLRRRIAGALDVRAVAEQRQDAFRSVPCECVQVKGLAVDRRKIDLEVAGVNYDSHGRANRQCDAINRAVRHADEFNFEGSHFQLPSGDNFAQVRLFEQPVFFQTLVHQRQRKPRPIDGCVQVAQNVG